MKPVRSAGSGPPETVAASYRPESQYLIGPDLYPTFKTVTTVVLMTTLAPWIVVLLVAWGIVRVVCHRLQ